MPGCCSRTINNMPASAGTAAASGVDGSIQFATAGALNSDAANLFWNDTTNRMGLGTSTPTQLLDVNGEALIDGPLNLGPSAIYRMREFGGNLVTEKFVAGVWVVRVTIP